MSAHLIPVVGRPFAQFAALTGGLTPDQALTALREGTLGAVRLVLGQGVTADEWSAVEAAVGGGVTADAFPLREPVSAGLHQRDPRNVLIADLEPAGRRRWRAAIVIHPESAPLADREAGTAHVPGMVEIEAGLQLLMAAAERYLLPDPGAYDFVSEHVDIEFKSFMFPLPATVEVQVDSAAWPDPSTLELEATAEIHQGGRPLMTMRFRSSAIEHGVLTGIERERAAKALSSTTELLEQR